MITLEPDLPTCLTNMFACFNVGQLICQTGKEKGQLTEADMQEKMCAEL